MYTYSLKDSMAMHGEADVDTSIYLRIRSEMNRCLIDIVLYNSCVKIFELHQ